MDLNALLWLAAITFIPWIELRGSIPWGIFVAGENPLAVFAFATAANMLVVIPAFLFLNLIFPFFENHARIKPHLSRLRAKTQKYAEKYGFLGLAVFVGMPFPGTGAYSGALGAYLLGIKKRRAVPAILLGVLAAGILVTAACVFFAEVARVMFGYA